MNVTRVLALLPLFVVLAHSFSWDIVVGTGNRLEFYDNGVVTYTETYPSASDITAVTYDPVQYRVFFTDCHQTYQTYNYIYSFDIASRKTQQIVMKITNDYFWSLAYDPVTQFLFWSQGLYNIYSLSLKTITFNKAVRDGHLVVNSNHDCRDIAVDSCGGYINWVTPHEIERAAFDGTEREVLISGHVKERRSLAIDQPTKKMYWIEESTDNQYSIKSADLNGKNIRTFYYIGPENGASALDVSKDFIYWKSYNQKAILQLSKDHQYSTNAYSDFSGRAWTHQNTAANYTVKEQTSGMKSCEVLKNLIPKPSVNNSVELRCNSSTCHNYCFQGNCSVSAEGHPKCSCEAGYSGIRCEVKACYMYCLNGGVCSLNEKDEPVCQCAADYEGERCDVPTSLTNVCVRADKATQQILQELKQVRDDVKSTMQQYSGTFDENAANTQKYEELMKFDLQNYNETTTELQI